MQKITTKFIIKIEILKEYIEKIQFFIINMDKALLISPPT